MSEPLVPLPSESAPLSSDAIPASSSTETTLTTSSVVSATTSEAVTTQAATSEASTTEAPTTASSTISSVASTASSAAAAGSSAASADAAAGAVAIANAPAQAEMCADNQDTLLTEWGLVVSNFRVEESSVEGTVCTTYNGMYTLANGQAAVKFTADANLVFEEATINDNKYYSNAGLGKNVPSQLSSISSIPASYSWSRTNTTDFRGEPSY